MKITRLHAWPITMGMADPYTIAYETVDHVTNVFIRLETNGPIIGYGCAAPDLEVTGETPDSVLKALEEEVSPAVTGMHPLRPAMLIERVKSRLNRHPSALSALDMALFDILGKKAVCPFGESLAVTGPE